MKGQKLSRFLTPNFIDACEEFMQQTEKRKVRLGEFLAWLARKKRKEQK